MGINYRRSKGHKRETSKAKVMGAWTKMAAVKVVRSNWILNIFSRQN